MQLPACRYTKGAWSECNTATNQRSRSLTLKKGDSSCEQSKTITKKCKKGQSPFIDSLFIIIKSFVDISSVVPIHQHTQKKKEKSQTRSFIPIRFGSSCVFFAGNQLVKANIRRNGNLG
jgi:hypothetical protein